MDGDSRAESGEADEKSVKGYEPIVQEELQHAPHNAGKVEVQGSISEILQATLSICLPIILLSVVFIALVFSLQVPLQYATNISEPSSLPEGHLDGANDAYYVNIDSTKLITVASWTSTIAGILPALIMSLVSYQVAAKYLDLCRNPGYSDLPTPYQFRLLIELCAGSPSSVGAVFRYMMWKKAKLNTLLRLAITALTLSAVFAIALFAVDPWLHVSTTEVNFVKSSPRAVQNFALSHTLSPECREKYPKALCTIVSPESDITDGIVINSTVAYQTLFNVSEGTRVLPFYGSDGMSYAYFAPSVAQTSSLLNYRASTIGIGTKCRTITPSCNTTWDAYNGLRFKCSENFHSQNQTNIFASGFRPFLDLSGVFLQYFEEPLQKLATVSPNQAWPAPAKHYFEETNPASFALGGTIIGSRKMRQDPQMLNNTDGSFSFVFLCESSVLEMNYTFTTAHSQATNFTFAEASPQIIDAVTMPWIIAGQTVWDAIISGLRAGALQESAEQFAQYTALTYSQTMLGLGVGAVVPASALQVSEGTTLQVTRLPKKPFYTVIALNAVYVIFAVVLAVLALAKRRGPLGEIRARIGLTGISAALFEPQHARFRARNASDMFPERLGSSENTRVALKPNSYGGWEYEIRRTKESSSQDSL